MEPLKRLVKPPALGLAPAGAGDVLEGDVDSLEKSTGAAGVLCVALKGVSTETEGS